MNVGAIGFVMGIVLLFVIVVVLSRYTRRFVPQDPVRVAARDAYQRALAYTKHTKTIARRSGALSCWAALPSTVTPAKTMTFPHA